MMTPKVSVLIPMYNRKHCIKQCVDSALNQTFQDFELVIRDNCSTDGSYEFIQEKYADKISSGKIKLFRNEKNLGEGGNCSKLFKDATGKYIAILHTDDMYLSHHLQHLFETAEKFNADVVHCSTFYNSPPDGIIQEGTKLYPVCWETRPAKQVEVFPHDLTARFNDWITAGTFQDAQYNLYNRKFILDNEIFFDTFDCEHEFFSLQWIMQAKVFVKTPVMSYVRRDSPYSGTNENFSAEKLEKVVTNKIELSYFMDKVLNKIDFFKNSEEAKYIAKSHVLKTRDEFDLWRRGIYKNGITPEIYRVIEKVFQKYFGENYFYPMFLFNWVHVLPFGKNVSLINHENQKSKTD